MLGRTEGRRRRGWQRMRLLDNITDLMDGHQIEQAPGDSEGLGSLACVCRVTQCRTQLSNWTTSHRNGEGHANPLQFSCLENSWTEETGRLQSMGLQRVGHDWCDLAQHNHQENVHSLSNGTGEDSGESLGQQGDQTSPSQRKSTWNIHWKDWCWSWSSNTLATWCEEPAH